MPPKRKIRNLPNVNDKDKINQMSFFDPVYQNDNIQMNNDESDSELSVNSLSRQTFRDKNKDESNETLDAIPMTNSLIRNENNEIFDEDQSSDISVPKIVNRIKQIQHSLQQAQQMLESMEKFKHLVPGTLEQSEKLHIIIANLEEQKAGYVNLLNLITLTNEERSVLIDRISASQRPISTNTDEDEENDLSPRRNARSPVRPRIESKIGFTPLPTISATPTVQPTINSSDNEQNNRNDNSNYDSLVGSLKSDTLNWKDQQSTSDDEASDGESEKEIERNLMLQKEQLRALQGQKRALLALKKRSEQRLIEQQQQQQQLNNKKTTDQKDDLSENDLLSDINNLRDRLKLLRNLYEQKHQVEVQQIKNPSKQQQAMPTENRLNNLQHVREQLDQLEQIVTYYQLDLINQPEEETTVYEETAIPPDDAQRLKTLILQQRQQTSSSSSINNDNTPKQFDKLSSELAAKRLELEQAKSALSRLQQMVKTIEPDECSSSVRSTLIQSSSIKPTNKNDYESNSNQCQYSPSSSQQFQTNIPNTKTSLLSSILSPKSTEQKKSTVTTNTYADVKMAAQHREIERLIESRQRLHTLKDQISTLHQNMTTPPIQSKKDSTQVDILKSKNQTMTYEVNPRNIRSTYSTNDQEDDDDDDDSELYRFECESGDGEEIDDDDDTDEEIQPRIKQENFHAPEDIVAEHEQRLLNKKSNSTDELNTQMREICRCLSTFIQEQKSFNRHIEEHLQVVTNPPPPPSQTVTSTSNINDPVFNQLQQQVLTQGLIVNLNTAYREIAILQSEINALQSENTRLTSSLSSQDSRYHYRPQIYSRDDSKDSIYSLDQIKPIRAQTRSRYDEQNQILTTNNKFENSSKTSFNSQSTGQQTAIHCEKNHNETTPTKHERNTTFSAERLSSPKPVHLHSKDNLSKSFVIRRRPISNDNEINLIQSQLFNYDQQNTFDIDDDDDDDDDESEDEQQTNELSKTIFNIQPSAYYTSTTHDLDNIDVQTLDLQIKSIMVQLIPFMRLHINDIFDQTILDHIRERILFLFKQQTDSAQLIRHFQNQFSQSLGKTIEKYCGTTIRDCSIDLIRDISDVIFDELIKYKTYENTNNNQTTNADEQIIQQISSIDDGENENKYQIELAESESRPLMLIGSDEEDNDSDQEENKDSELETAVSRQDSILHRNEITSSTESNSNGHEYVLVNRSTSNDDVVPENEEKKNENQQIEDS